MKRFAFRTALALWILSAPVAIALALCNNFAIRRLAIKQDKTVNELYIMLAIQARQIRTLQNLELRRTNPEIQRRLKLEREKFARTEDDN